MVDRASGGLSWRALVVRVAKYLVAQPPSAGKSEESPPGARVPHCRLRWRGAFVVAS